MKRQTTARVREVRSMRIGGCNADGNGSMSKGEETAEDGMNGNAQSTLTSGWDVDADGMM